MNELDGYDIEDLRIGMRASFAKTITEADIAKRLVFLDTICRVGEIVVIEGDAVVKVRGSASPRPPIRSARS